MLGDLSKVLVNLKLGSNLVKTLGKKDMSHSKTETGPTVDVPS